jgi:crotonobetainyl-CoA:carnitine CoA-transferase CaiB-like acyl-CoA transferase
VAIDLAHPDGQDLVRQLARGADVIVENFKVGGLAKYGLGYADIEAVNPRAIYLSISAFGQDGPDAAGPGYDAAIQGMGGLMSLTGVPEGEPGAGPQKVGVAVADLMCGMYAVASVLAALFERQHSGRGQYIDLALLDTQVAWLANQNLNYLLSGVAPQRQGTAHPNIVPYQSFATADGYMMLSVGNDGQFARFCAAAGQPQLAADSRFATNQGRVANRVELVPLVQQMLRARSTSDWLARLRVANVPCGPINDLAQVFAEPQVRHRGMRIDLPHPVAGSVPGVRNPALFSRTPLEYVRAPPLLGADTASVLREKLGLEPVRLDELRKNGAIG